MDSSKYIGIPFAPGGRDITGLDCWGLVRLFYKEELDIDLPSFNTSYHISDNERIGELIAQYREGWDTIESPQRGDIVVFNIFGQTVHLGVMLDQEQFLHIRENRDSVVDKITGTRWNRRIEGFYRYNSKALVTLNAAPHPLKTVSITSYITEGTNLEELYQKVNSENNIATEIAKDAVIIVNGIPVPRVQWVNTYLKRTDTVEYRAVAGKEAIKMVALIVIAYYAPYLVEYFAPELVAVASTATAAPVLTLGGTIAAAAITVAGSYLINAISPIRPPSSEDPGSATQQNLITGNSNPYNPYGAIPVVLGKIRYNPPLGAKSFITYPTTNEMYLNMMLVWGYGPLYIDESTMRVGDVPIGDYTLADGNAGIGKITLDRITEPSTTTKESFDSIYGKDVDQFFKNINMEGPEYNAGTSVGGEELPPYVNPRTNSGQLLQDLEFDIYRGQPVFPLPPPPPGDTFDDTIYEVQQP